MVWWNLYFDPCIALNVIRADTGMCFTLAIVLVLFLALLFFHIKTFRKNRRKSLKLAQSIEELTRANNLKNQFFSIISHDLKEPFNGILGLSNYLHDEYHQISDDEKKEIVSDINLAAKSAFNLLHNLLNWARTQTGTMINHPVTLNARQIIDFALETVFNMAKHKEIELKIDADPKLQIYADENMILTILRNLISNAIKFSPRRSEVLIRARRHNDQTIFSVQDQGIGLSANEIDLLFRVDIHFQKKGTEKESGTGLGLILCHELALLCKGKLWVVSQPNEGSTFFLSVPSKYNSTNPK